MFPSRSASATMSSATGATLQLREMILRGEIAPGERVREADLASRLGMSRTPVRQALPALAQEGLLVRAGQRGFAVKAFSATESQEALRLRGVLEGTAARVLAERGATDEVLQELRACLDAGDALFARRTAAGIDEARYGDMNARFHELLLAGARMPLLADLVARCTIVPFTAPHSIAFFGIGRQAASDLLFYAHRQHHAIVDAITARQPDRAEFLLREHAAAQEHAMNMPADGAAPRDPGRSAAQAGP